MERPLNDKRPLGPFAQLSGHDSRLAFQYSSNTVDVNLPDNFDMEQALEEAWRNSDAVARVESMKKIVPSGKGVTAVKVGVSPVTMTQDQFNEAIDIGRRTLEDMGVDVFQSAITLTDK